MFTLRSSGRVFWRHKKSPGLLKLVKMKLNKNMSDDAAAKLSLIAAGVVLAVGIFLFTFGAIQGAA